MKLSPRQRIVIVLICISAAAISLVTAIPSMALALYLIALLVVIAAGVLEIEEYLSLREKRDKP